MMAATRRRQPPCSSAISDDNDGSVVCHSVRQEIPPGDWQDWQDWQSIVSALCFSGAEPGSPVPSPLLPWPDRGRLTPSGCYGMPITRSSSFGIASNSLSRLFPTSSTQSAPTRVSLAVPSSSSPHIFDPSPPTSQSDASSVVRSISQDSSVSPPPRPYAAPTLTSTVVVATNTSPAATRADSPTVPDVPPTGSPTIPSVRIEGLSKTTIAEVALGVTAVFLLVISAFILLWRRRHRRKGRKNVKVSHLDIGRTEAPDLDEMLPPYAATPRFLHDTRGRPASDKDGSDAKIPTYGYTLYGQQVVGGNGSCEEVTPNRDHQMDSPPRPIVLAPMRRHG
ncbi:hypothetical protein C8Q80DRAFT_442727 [Daedaleopsis nitida]|nr:hypothetical protein C8Q80DRAFT_442727 [Daedaleopsis nitida]